MATEQTEKAFQKQAGVFSGRDQRALGKKGKGKGARFWKNIGLGFKTPKEAIEGHYVDQNCPFTGMYIVRVFAYVYVACVCDGGGGFGGDRRRRSAEDRCCDRDECSG
jgi:hypothetical protein